MHKARIGVFGGSGYSGLEATRLLAAHPGVALDFVAGDRWEGESVAERSGTASALEYLSADAAGERARRCDAVLLATPAEASLKWAAALLDAGVRVVDFSGAFRLKDAGLYPRYYGFEHPHPELLARAVYGLPELFRDAVRGAALVASAGCYATGATLALAPLTRADLLEEGSLVVNAASGVTGAGRKASEDYSFAEVDSDFRAYRVLRHQHAPELAQTLGHRLTLTTHLLPVRRGILVTATARLRPGVGAAAVRAALGDAYGAEALVELRPSPEDISLKAVVGTPRCRIGAACEDGVVVVVAAIDNLLKGAASQAVQNLNLMMGWAETTGLEGLRAFHS
jgi:N-acetyl-gamma-glutamyl-phosphate reductase